MDAMGFRQRLAGVMFHLRQAIQPLDNLGCLQVNEREKALTSPRWPSDGDVSQY
jgi:hypothetical protein